MRFVRLRSPLRILTADLGVFKSCARNSMSASLARPSTADACNRTFNAPQISPETSSLLARGRTRTWKTTAPFLSCISSTVKLPGPLVLDGRLDFLAQDLCRAAGPIRIAQQFACHDHQVRLTRFQNGIGLLRLGNHANRAGCNPRLLPNLLGEFHLVSRADRNLRTGHDAATGHVDEVHADSLQSLAQLDGLLQVPSAFFPISGGNANK